MLLSKRQCFNRDGQFGNSILHKSKEGLAQGPEGTIKFNNRDFAFFASSSVESYFKFNESFGLVNGLVYSLQIYLVLVIQTFFKRIALVAFFLYRLFFN